MSHFYYNYVLIYLNIWFKKQLNQKNYILNISRSALKSHNLQLYYVLCSENNSEDTPCVSSGSYHPVEGCS